MFSDAYLQRKIAVVSCFCALYEIFKSHTILEVLKDEASGYGGIECGHPIKTSTQIPIVAPDFLRYNSPMLSSRMAES